ncbi:hypothetical protein QQF64_026356 [Cirrhinus molitorella]|uniref:Uncharacterized protein n=1 Tax=Cirrhinus molitorella TaxID=172907 RepID=A0ABR3N9B7_9TELE
MDRLMILISTVTHKCQILLRNSMTDRFASNERESAGWEWNKDVLLLEESGKALVSNTPPIQRRKSSQSQCATERCALYEQINVNLLRFKRIICRMADRKILAA